MVQKAITNKLYSVANRKIVLNSIIDRLTVICISPAHCGWNTSNAEFHLFYAKQISEFNFVWVWRHCS